MADDLLTPEQLAEIEQDIAERDDTNAMSSACGEYNCPCHNRLPALLRHARALQSEVNAQAKAFELDAATKIPEVGGLNCLQIIKKVNELAGERAQLQEAVRQGAIIYEPVIVQRIEEFRQRCVEAVRARTIPDNARDGHPLSDAGYNLAIDDVIDLLQSLPATRALLDDEDDEEREQPLGSKHSHSSPLLRFLY